MLSISRRVAAAAAGGAGRAVARAPVVVARGLRHGSTGSLIRSPPLVVITGEEMTRYAMQLIFDQWVKPHIDTSKWEYYDLSCKARDDTEDQVLHDAVSAGKRIGAIFKEPTITPTEVQKEELGLKKAWGSPNGAMRRGWNGITISRDTIMIDGVDLGFVEPVFFERHAVGGEYGAGWSTVGKGRLITTHFPDDDSKPTIVDARVLDNESNVAVVYHNPLDNVGDLAHHFFSRCLKARIVPYVVTKKTVFKWQEGFWQRMKQVFDEHYREDFLAAGLLDNCGGELQHLISDAATMQIIRWTHGGWGMAAHNYDGDMLTDEVAQVHRSPGFITSNLIGKNDDGSLIKEFEASHGTVADLWKMHLDGEETSFNPLGMAEALMGALDHAADLAVERAGGESDSDVEDAASAAEQIKEYTATLRKALHNTFRNGQGTRDIAGPSGLTTEEFTEVVADRLARYLNKREREPVAEKAEVDNSGLHDAVDKDAVEQLFSQHDADNDGVITLDEFEDLLVHLGVAPLKPEKIKHKSDADV